MNRILARLEDLLEAAVRDPLFFARQVAVAAPAAWRGSRFARRFTGGGAPGPEAAEADAANPLWAWFQGHTEGRGVWKWHHYFPMYHRHLARFVGRETSVVEIGVYGGGSLDMWRSYFGDRCSIVGVDIDPACKALERRGISIVVGDQADRAFWARFREQVPAVDVLIDDGGHTPEQQQVTLEEMLPHVRPGGVYICEDIAGIRNRFAAFARGLVAELNGFSPLPGVELRSRPSSLQAAVHSIHFYPYALVIEKHGAPPSELRASKRGTEWSGASGA